MTDQKSDRPIEVGEELIVKRGCEITHWIVKHIREDGGVTLLRFERGMAKSWKMSRQQFVERRVWSDKAKESLRRIDEEKAEQEKGK